MRGLQEMVQSSQKFFRPSFLYKNSKIGSILVKQGSLTEAQLKQALAEQKVSKTSLGKICIDNNLVSQRQINKALRRQIFTRCVATLILTFMSLGTFGAKKAMAGDIKDVPARITVAFNNDANPYGTLTSYPEVFGTVEKQSSNVKPFTKWQDMFTKFDHQLNAGRSNTLVREWQRSLKRYEGLGLKDMAIKVNDLVNAKPYINDKQNYGTSDYWATPIEFLKKGGDCEDFAIAKYVALRALGVPENRLRVAIVQDLKKNIPHAVLIVYTDEGVFALDNQIKTLVNTHYDGRYRPIYSINRTAWWLHTAPTESTRVALR